MFFFFIFQGNTREKIAAFRLFEPEMQKLHTGNYEDFDYGIAKPFIGNMAKDILVQKQRLGGDFAVAHAVMKRDMRDHIRTILPDCIFVVLSLTDETQCKRIKERHGEGSESLSEHLVKMHQLYEKPGDGEKNTYNVDITEDMTRKDVFNKVMEILKDNCS